MHCQQTDVGCSLLFGAWKKAWSKSNASTPGNCRSMDGTSATENWVPRMRLTTSEQGIADPRRGSNERIPVLSLCLPAAPLFIFQCLFRSSRSQSPARRVDLSAHGRDAPPVSWEWEVGRLYQLKDCCKCFLGFLIHQVHSAVLYLYDIYIYTNNWVPNNYHINILYCRTMSNNRVSLNRHCHDTATYTAHTSHTHLSSWS